MSKPTFRSMAVCTSCGERIENPVYVDGKPYCEVDGEVKRDYIKSPNLKKDLKDKRKMIRSFK